MEKNKKLLRKIRNHILEEPYRYDQLVIGKRSRKAPCGTAGCLYGWATVLGGLANNKQLRNIYTISDCKMFEFKKISELLGFTPQEEDIVSDAEGEGWPLKYGEALRKAQKKKDKFGEARAAANYINFIIRTGRVTDEPANNYSRGWD